MKKDREQILVDFSVPVVNKNLTKTVADPFDLMVNKKNYTCRMKYSGQCPKNVFLYPFHSRLVLTMWSIKEVFSRLYIESK